MSGTALDEDRALIARNRVAELKRCGWRVVGPAEEGAVWMEGPPLGDRFRRRAAGWSASFGRDNDGDGDTGGQPVGALFNALVTRALARADAADLAAQRAARRAA
ncbi:hypothetical protein [Azospirillum griseum]|uniref:Uncharacterized protein n=1 Tax=Azospirillum griseum TaxID=2496639 RepID=A0A3S0ICI6_9PROT|nr:hypothetical protein [Azospirillum griseum]RTR16559.1 hypothetical protein EJ903_20190 [Azospirillum griseum]